METVQERNLIEEICEIVDQLAKSDCESCIKQRVQACIIPPSHHHCLNLSFVQRFDYELQALYVLHSRLNEAEFERLNNLFEMME